MPFKYCPADRLRPQAIWVCVSYASEPTNNDNNNNTIYSDWPLVLTNPLKTQILSYDIKETAALRRVCTCVCVCVCVCVCIRKIYYIQRSKTFLKMTEVRYVCQSRPKVTGSTHAYFPSSKTRRGISCQDIPISLPRIPFVPVEVWCLVYKIICPHEVSEHLNVPRQNAWQAAGVNMRILIHVESCYILI